MPKDKNMIFSKAVSFPLNGYSKCILRFILRIFTNRHIVYRNVQGDNNFSEIRKYPLPDNSNNLKPVIDELGNFYKSFEGEGFFYKGVSIPRIFNRSPDFFLHEYFNLISQIKTYKNDHPDVEFVSDGAISELLKLNHINCKENIFLTFVYESLKNIRMILGFLKKEYRSKMPDLRVYVYRKQNKPRVLVMGINKHRGLSYLKLSRYLRKEFEVVFMTLEEPPTANPSPINDAECLEVDVNHLKYKKVYNKFIKYFKMAEPKSNVLHRVLSDILYRSIIQRFFAVLHMIDTLELLNKDKNINGVITGMTYNWPYNITNQWAKHNSIKSIFHEGSFLAEDLNLLVDSDIALISSKIFARKLESSGYDRKKIGFTTKLNDFLNKSPFELTNINQGEARQYLGDIFKKYSLNIIGKKLVLLATDPGNYLNTKEHKYISELFILNELKKNSDFFLIIKLHSQDDGFISKMALKDSKSKNALVLKDVDFYKLLSACDVFVSTYSTSVMEAIIMGKFVMLMNLERHNYYRLAVKYGVAYYIEKEGDFERIYNDSHSYMVNIKNRVQKYLKDIYFDNDLQDKEVSELIYDFIV